MKPAGKLPDFLVIGAQRCGTTSFYRLLCQHPLVEGAARKEVHYFDLHFQKGEEWYRSFFPEAEREDRVTGESSPYYIFHPLSAERAARLVPGARLIVLLRNPVDRAYSHYQHGLRRGYETLPTFEQALEAEPGRLAGEREKILAGEPGGLAYQRFSYATRGVYVDQLLRWREHFPAESLLVMGSEDYYRDPLEVAARAQRHLDLLFRELRVSGDNNEDNRDVDYPPMRQETRRALADYFAPHNERLYELLGVDFGWR